MPIRRSSRLLLVALTTLLALAALGPPASARVEEGTGPPPPARPEAHRIDAALAWSSLLADGGSPTAILARADLDADPLTSSSLQNRFGAPLLLTGSDRLDRQVARELSRLGTDRVIVVGGTAAVGTGVIADLEHAGITVERAAGPDRVSTATAVAATYFPSATRAIILAAGADDEAAIPAWAATQVAGASAAHLGIPILLTDSQHLSDAIADYLAGSAVTAVLVGGDEGAISRVVVEELTSMGLLVSRDGTADRA